MTPKKCLGWSHHRGANVNHLKYQGILNFFQTNLLSIIALHVQEVGGVHSPVNTLLIAGDTALDGDPLRCWAVHKVLQVLCGVRGHCPSLSPHPSGIQVLKTVMITDLGLRRIFPDGGGWRFMCFRPLTHPMDKTSLSPEETLGAIHPFPRTLSKTVQRTPLRY